MSFPGGDFRGRAAVVTGGSRGIGRGIAWALAASGADVVISSRKQQDLDKVAAEAAGLPGRIVPFAANAGDPEAAEAAIACAISTFGAVDILVNNAATNPFYGNLVDLDPARADKIVKVNQFGVVSWVASAWRAWMSQHGGVILNITSAGGFGVDRGIGYYNATKAAVIHLTRQLAAELSPAVRVNSIAPGVVRTDMSRALWEGRETELVGSIPLGRFGEPEDIAAAALFLLSDHASWITGQTLVVDGGVSARPMLVHSVDSGPHDSTSEH